MNDNTKKLQLSKRLIILSVALFLIMAGVFLYSSGYLLLISGAVASIFGFVVIYGIAAMAIKRLIGSTLSLTIIGNVSLVIFSVFLSLIAFEFYLNLNQNEVYASSEADVSSNNEEKNKIRLGEGILEPAPTLLKPEAIQKIKMRRGILAMPEEWKRRDVKIPGTAVSYYWHKELHEITAEGFRGTGPFPPKQDDVFRIMVIGDSLTYGYGINKKFTYPALIEEELAREYKVEVLNLGVSGQQSEDILRILKNNLTKLEPDLVIYGICHNDFLDSGIGQYDKRDAFSLPIPVIIKDRFTSNTLVGSFMDTNYNKLLIEWGFRKDFFDDILSNFGGLQSRFERDLKNMNNFVLSNGLPSIIGMVVDQIPRDGQRGHKITHAAERAMHDAKFNVIYLDEYYKTYSGHNMMVSLWEGHPNEEANAIFAEYFLKAISSSGLMEKYRK